MHRQPLDLPTLHAAYAKGLDAAAVIDGCYDRLAEVDDPGIFIALVDRAAAHSELRALGPFDPVARPLWGVPFAIKDNIDAAGLPTTAGCPAYSYPAARDAHAVAALRRAGAILLGKTNLDQFATGLVGVRTPYPVPRNALDPALVPGGSSSGSAVAVAQGIVSFALGTDTAGSGRVPAALNGIVGLKPTLGALSARGVVPACRSLDTVSVFALTVDDAHAVFSVAGVFDPDDAYARPVDTARPGPAPPAFRVGVPDAASRRFLDDAHQSASFAATLGVLAELGGETVELDFGPFFEVAELLYGGPWLAERLTVVEALLEEDPHSLHPVTHRVIEQARDLRPAAMFRDFYRLQELKRLTAAPLAGVDLLCVPSVPTLYTVDEVAADPLGTNARLGTYTNFVNLLDLCGLTVPVAARGDGRPGSVTLLAAAGRDAQVAAVGAALQRVCAAPLGATGWRLSPSVVPSPRTADHEIALAVCGAHMAGLPLNSELTRLGGRFLQATRTAPCYRLYALAGGPPKRPGMLREAGGAAIELEVWALPAARFGDFVRGIPRPLGIGTLVLESGDEVKGFLCEPDGLAGAEEITHHGGWRAYLGSTSPAPPPVKETVNATT